MKKESQKENNHKKSLIRRVIVLSALIVLFAILMLLTLNKNICEFFATTLSRAWIFVFGNVLGWIPVSFYELFLIVVILGAIAFVVIEIILLCKHKWYKSLTALVIVAICVFSFLNIYTATASFAYNRAELPTSVYEEYSGDDLTVDEAIEIAEYIIDKANEAYHATVHDSNGNIVFPYSVKEMSDILDKEYRKLDSKYFSSYTPHGKKIINKTIT